LCARLQRANPGQEDKGRKLSKVQAAKKLRSGSKSA
jgi:hypothetical protein